MTRQVKSNEMLEGWQAAIDQKGDVFCSMLQTMVQQFLEHEVAALLAAAPHERTEERQGYRNGYKPRRLKTRVGELELRMPQVREGRFQTGLFERYQRSEKAFMLALMEMYVQGVSTRKVRQITERLCGVEVSKSQVSALAAELDAMLEEWRKRPLEKKYPYLVVDARYEKVRENHRVMSKGVLLVVGIDAEGYREILGVWTADSESEASWSEVFAELRGRGLKGVEYVVSDDHRGLVQAINRHFQGALWQRCQVHFVRNALSRVKQKDRPEVLRILKRITQSATREEATENLNAAVQTLEPRHPALAEWLEEHGEEILAVYQLPEKHRRKLRSTNMLERFNQEIKRRTLVVRIFPNQAACLRLVSALAAETSEEWSERRYLDLSREEPSNEETEKQPPTIEAAEKIEAA